MEETDKYRVFRDSDGSLRKQFNLLGCGLNLPFKQADSFLKIFLSRLGGMVL